MSVLLIDNFDSFTYNLQHLVLLEGVDCTVWRNNDPRLLGDLDTFTAIILSPGPGIPIHSGNLMEVISRWNTKIPMLGICLGHQALGLHFGAKLIAAPRPLHGMVSQIRLCADEGEIPWMGEAGTIVEVMRYHSWVLGDLPECLIPLAYSIEDDCLMALRHRTLPLYGVQFHPESVVGIEVRQLVATFVRQSPVFL
ncbi:MAG: aminodeoxychorismate/anthranilate synthase component II [Sphingomonadales bacterium]|nr:aminodeoxychorismate/anthranilate synthase component II [Sphingomonadales bacterium]